MKEIRLVYNGVSEEYTVAELKAKKLNHFKGWTCSVGVEGVYIDFDGLIWRGPCRVGGPIGHSKIWWERPDSEIVCTRDTCDCGTGIKMPKRYTDRHLVPIHSQLIPIQWDLGRRCNFDCSYCWPSSHNKTDTWISGDDMKSIIDRLHTLHDGRTMQFNFAGGEPTLHPQFAEVCRYIVNMGHKIHVQTNGSMNIATARTLADFGEISISVHFEFANLDKLIRNIEAILEVQRARKNLEVKMMLAPVPGGLESVRAFRDRLAEVEGIERARVIVSPLRDPQTNRLMSYSPAELEEFGDVEF